MAPSKDQRTPMPHTKLDPRINDIPIPLTFQDNSIHIQNALLPYFALGFIPVSTPGTDLECGLHALMISYNAARRQFNPRSSVNRNFHDDNPDDEEEEEDANTGELENITLAQWKNWLNSSAYNSACRKILKNIPVYTSLSTRGKQRLMKEWQEKTNIGEDVMAVLLSMANENFNTDFRLGILCDGYRGRWERYKNPTKEQRDFNGNAPISEVFDNTFVCKAHARMSNVDVGDGPVLWVKNDNYNAMSLDHYDETAVNHWEGFAPPSEETPGVDARRKAIQKYGIGACLEVDINNGVWYLTDYYDKKGPDGYIWAFEGAFLRPQENPPEEPDPLQTYLQTSNGQAWKLRNEDVVKIGMAAFAPTATTDPTPEEMQLPPSLPLPDIGRVPPPRPRQNKNKNKNQNRGGKTGRKNGDKPNYNPCRKDRQGRLPYIDQLFKIFRVLPTTNKAGLFLPSLPESKIKIKQFKFEIGDFVLDMGQPRKNLMVEVKDMKGQRGPVSLRRLQALENPWGYPDTLPVRNYKYYACPETLSSAKSCAKFHGYTDLDFDNKANAMEELHKRLTQKSYEECPAPILYRVIETTKGNGRAYKGPCEEGEIVRKMSTKKRGKIISHVVVNYEGFEHLIPDGAIEEVNGNFWEMFINLKEWRNQKKTIKYDGGAEQSDDEIENALGSKAKKVVGGSRQVPKGTDRQTNQGNAVTSEDESEDQADEGNIMDIDESEEE